VALLVGHVAELRHPLEVVLARCTGQRVAAAGDDNTVRLWPAFASAGMLCDKLTANMSRKNWREWVSQDIAYVTLCPGLAVPAE
jgi:hypothetical protein